MIVYFATFLVSYYIGLHAEIERGKWWLFWVVASFLPMAVLAGLRAPEIGIDTGYYPLPFYHYSLRMSLFDMIKNAACEPGFSIFIWVSSRLTRSFNAVLFLVQGLTIAPLVWAISRFNVKKISLVVLVYACVIFPASLNIMRQSIAASFLLPALYFSLNKKWGKFSLMLLVAVSFHLSALLGLLLLPTAILSTSDLTKQAKYIKLFVVISTFFLALFIIFRFQILRFISIFKESYSVLLAQADEGTFNTLVTLFPLSTGFLGLFTYRDCGESAEKSALLSLSLTLILAGGMSFLSLVSPTLSRLGQLFLVFSPFAVAKAADSSSSRLPAIFLSAFCLLIFYWVYCHGDAAGIIPYSIGFVS